MAPPMKVGINQYPHVVFQISGAPNETSWQISAPQPAYSWLARETEKFKILAGKLKI